MERAGADLGAEHRVADDERGDRHDEPEDALGGDVGEGVGRRGSSIAWASRPNSSAPAHGSSTAAHRFGRQARPQRVDDDRDEPRPRATCRSARRPARSSDQLPEQALERVVERAHLEQADRRVAGRAAAARVGQLARLQRLDDQPVAVRRRTSRRRPTRAPTSAAASRRPSSERTSTWRGRSSIASRIARWPPAAASRPWTSTITRSASRSTSLSTCELTITVRPSAPSRLNSSIRCTRCTGSAPFSGSSSTSTCGSVTSAAATLVRWRMPLLKPSTRRSATSSRPTVSQRAVGRVAVGDAVQLGDVAHELPGGEPGRHGLVLGHQRHRARARCGRGGGRGRRRARVPWLTPTSPVIARISVVLPAPFGPSRPVTPGPNEQLSSDSATFGPNHTDDVVDLDRGVGDERRVESARSAIGGGRRRERRISARPIGSGAAARRCRRTSTTRYASTREQAAAVDTPSSGESGSMWPRNTRSRRYSGSASTLISAAADPPVDS